MVNKDQCYYASLDLYELSQNKYFDLFKVFNTFDNCTDIRRVAIDTKKLKMLKTFCSFLSRTNVDK